MGELGGVGGGGSFVHRPITQCDDEFCAPNQLRIVVLCGCCFFFGFFFCLFLSWQLLYLSLFSRFLSFFRFRFSLHRFCHFRSRFVTLFPPVGVGLRTKTITDNRPVSTGTTECAQYYSREPTEVAQYIIGAALLR